MRGEYQGVVVPMVTPFTAEGHLDEPAACRIIEHLLDGGVAGVFVLGTTGEEASMPRPLRGRLVALTVKQVAGRARVYAGISDNCLTNSIEDAQAYRRLGVDVCVARLPAYFPLTPHEQYTYYAKLAREIPGPLMIYNIPSTTHMSIPVEVVLRLTAIPNIVGLKDSERSQERLEMVMAALGGREDFAILVGAVPFTARGLALGAHGSVPSCGNLVPALCQKLHEAGIAGDVLAADAYQRQLDQVSAIYGSGRSVGQAIAGLKAVMGEYNLCEAHVLPPLHSLDTAQQAAVCAQFASWQRHQ